jgi:hypothetical protein
VDVTTGSGGGQPNKVTVVIERRNSSCVVQETILSQVSANLTAGTTEEIDLSEAASAVTFGATDILTVRIVRSQGGRSQVARYDGADPSDADSRITWPDPVAVLTQGEWRWYTDATPDTSMVAKAAQDTKCTFVEADMQGGIVRLRVAINETGGGADTPAIQLQYSVDNTNWLDIDDNPAALSGPYYRWGAGAATHGNTITTQHLSSTTASGKYHEADALTESVAANAKHEIDIALAVLWPVPGVTYRFRLVADGTPLAPDSGEVQIQADGSTAAVRGYAIDDQDPDDIDIPPRDLRFSSQPKLFWDGTYWWAFHVQESDPTNVCYHYWSGSGDWSAGTTIGFTNGVNKNSLGLAFKVISGTPVIWIAAVDSDASGTAIYYRRGTISGTTITWANEANVSQNNTVRSVSVDLDDGNYIWFAVHNSGSMVAIRSTNADTGSSWTSGWETAVTASETAPGSRSNITVVGLESNKCMVLWEASGGADIRYTLADTTSMDTPADVNATADAHPEDWGVCRDGTYVYVVHTDNSGSGGNWVLRVFTESSETWATGTSPSVSGQTTSDDGILVTRDGDDLYAFGTFSVGSLGGRVLKYKKYAGPGASGTWDGSLSTITPATDRGNGDFILGTRDIMGANQLPVLWCFGDDGLVGSGSTLEYHYLTGLNPPVAAAIPIFQRPMRRVTPGRF